MKLFPRLWLYFLTTVCFGVVFTPVALGGDNWRPVTPQELAMKTPVVEKDADAEAIFWEVKIDDDEQGLILTHYVRIKIFTDRGKETQSKVEIPFGKFFGRETKIGDIAARTIKPDGTIVELQKSDIFETTQVKASGAKIKVKSFAVPGIEVGSIIDYRWREVRPNASANYIRLQFQRDVPAQLVKYLIKPYPYEGYGMRTQTFHGLSSPFAKEKNGFYSTTMTNMPALREEPQMPPEDQVRTWMLVYYTQENKIVPERFWRDWGKAIYELHKSDLKLSDEVRRAATEAIGDADTSQKKLERLYNYVRAKVTNVNDDALGLTPEERAKIKENKSPADTLKRAKGTPEDMDMLFGALAIAAGFDAHVVELPDRSDFFFDERFPDGYFLRLHCIAVQIDATWQFFDPGNAYCPFGMLPWWKEGEKALILDAKEPTWTTTPTSAPSKSAKNRTGKFKLSEDGTLEGDVTLEYTGQVAIEKKEEQDDDSPAQREEALRAEIRSRLSTAELSDVKIENVTDPIKPLVCSFHIRVPGYAQRTGKRLFIQPSFFQHGLSAMFGATDRKQAVYFHYPWLEKDQVEIGLPTGYALDNADKPGPFVAGEISQYKLNLAVTTDGHTLMLQREFFFGGGGSVLFPVSTYSQLKRLFDQLSTNDEHMITLKQTGS
jgi:hypothetical protein